MTHEDVQGEESRRAQQPSPPIRVLHLLTLGGFAFAQPLYGLISRNATFLVAHDASASDIVILALTLSLGLPLILIAVEEACRLLSGVAGAMVFRVEMGVLAWLMVLPPLKTLGLGAPWALIGLGATIGLVFAVLHGRLPLLRTWVSLASPAVIIFPVIFLFFSPVTTIWAPADVGAGEGAVHSDTPVVLVVFDELPISSLLDEELAINGLRYPAFAALADEAWWFRNANTVSQSTHYAVPAILTGRYPERTCVPTVGEYPENLFTLLGTAYEQRVIETMTRLCPGDLNSARTAPAPLADRVRSLFRDTGIVYLHVLLPQTLIPDLPAIDAAWRDFGGPVGELAKDPVSRASDSTWIFEYFLEQIHRARRPALYFVHVNLPHLPWKYLPSGTEYGPVGSSLYPHGLCGERWCGSDWEVLQGWQRHLLQAAYADCLLGRLVAALREAGLYERSLIVITADHGASFINGAGRREVMSDTVSDILRVPMFIKVPGQDAGAVSDRCVSTIDIVPTIADRLGAELPWTFDGRSVFDQDAPERTGAVMFRTEGSALGDRLEFGATTEGVLSTVRRQTSAFGLGRAGENRDLYAFGPHAGLVGQAVSAVPSAEPSGLEAEIIESWSFDSVDRDSGFVPAHVVGRLKRAGEEPEPIRLAVTVNGVIAGCTETYRHSGGEVRFSALVAESAFAAGRNAVELFAIKGDADSPRLAPVRVLSSLTCSLERMASGEIEAVVCSDGRRFDVMPGRFNGDFTTRGLAVRGWAADLAAGKRCSSVLVFRGDDFLFETPTTVRRPDVVRRSGRQALLHTGFRFVVPEYLREDREIESLHLFALCGEVASEIHRGARDGS